MHGPAVDHARRKRRIQPMVPLPAGAFLGGSSASSRWCADIGPGKRPRSRLTASQQQDRLLPLGRMCPAGHRTTVTCSEAAGSSLSPCRYDQTDVMAALRPNERQTTATGGTAAGLANSLRRVAGDRGIPALSYVFLCASFCPFSSAKAVQKIVPVRLRSPLSRTGRLGRRHPP